MRINVLARLTCGHTALFKGIREEHVPKVAWCDTCHEGHEVRDTVDNKPLIAPDGKAW